MAENLTVGRFALQERLGQGGFGEVFKAFDDWKNKVVAVKIGRLSNLAPPEVLQFCSEFLKLKQLKHPGIVSVFDWIYLPDEVVGYSMEYLEGVNLVNFLCQKNQKVIASVFFQIAEVLEFLHLKKIIHCDLKGENFIVTLDGKVKLTDFGLASVDMETKQKKGTLGYIAPEILKGEAFTGKADLYSLGVILYQVLCGRLPFEETELALLLSAHLEKKPSSPAELNPEISPEWEKIINSLLEKDPTLRISATQLKEELKNNFLSGHSYDRKNFIRNFLASGKFINQKEILGKFRTFLDDIKSKGGRVVLIQGKTGEGKSKILNELEILTQTENHLFFKISPGELQVLDLERVFFRVASLLKTKNKAVANAIENLRLKLKSVDEGKSEVKSVEVFQELATCLAEGFEQQGLVLALEDIEKQDLKTFLFLKALCAQTGTVKILAVATYNPEKLSPGSPLKQFLIPEIESLWLSSFKLESLTEKETAELICEMLPGISTDSSLFSYVQQKSSGNPFLIQEILKELFEKQVLDFEKGIWIVKQELLDRQPLAQTVEDYLIQSLQKYNSEQIQILKLASVLEFEFDMEQIQTISQKDSDFLFENFYKFMDDKVLSFQMQNGSVGYRFINTALKEILYSRVENQQKNLWHHQIADFLEERYKRGGLAEVEKVAYHYAHTSEVSKGFHYCLLAVERLLSKSANQEVLKYLELGLDCARKLEDRKLSLESQAQILLKKGNFWRNLGDLDRALRDFQEAQELLFQLPENPLLAEAFRELGSLYRLRRDFQKGENYLTKALNLFRKFQDRPSIAKTLNNLGLVYEVDNQYPKALEVYGEALKLHRELNDLSKVASTLNNMGIIQGYTQNYANAIILFNEALETQKKLKDEKEQALALINLGWIYFCLEEYSKSEIYWKEALNLLNKIGNKVDKTIALENLAECFQKKGNQQIAVEYAQEGLFLSQELDLVPKKARILRILGNSFFQLGEYNKAFNCLNQCQKIAESLTDRELQELIFLDLGSYFLEFSIVAEVENKLNQAIEIIQKIKEKKSEIVYLVLKGKLENIKKSYPKAQRLLEKAYNQACEFNLNEEKLFTFLNWVEVCLNRNDQRQAGELLRKAGALFDRAKFGFYEPWLELLLGINALSSDIGEDRQEAALSHLNRAYQKALEMEQKRILWKILFYLGQVSEINLNYEKAFLSYKEAVEIIKLISSSIPSPEWKQSFLEDDMKKKLFEKLKFVSTKLIGATK